ncbi:MAG TPA: tetratricopeptide repeat protein [bacterium]
MRFSRCAVLLFAVFLLVSSLHSQVDSTGVAVWILELKKNPNDLEALRNLGVYGFENGKTDVSAQCWLRVYKQKPSDPQALYYLGRLLEAKNRKSQALALYGRFAEAPKSSPFRGKMVERYRVLSREKLKAEMRRLLDQENTLGDEPPSENTVAVFPFEYRGTNAKLSPLGKGLAEMVMTDLSQVRDLKVVERVRVQALFDEAVLAQSGLAREEGAPALGKLLKAGKMVYGGFRMRDQNDVVLDVTYADAVNQTASEPMEFSDALKNLFLLEKDAVFRIIDGMGIRLTPREKERIQRIPTKNLMAFVNYCMGLEMEDKGEFEQASTYFQKALTIDPAFSSAQLKIQGGDVLASAEASEPSSRPDGRKAAPKKVSSLPDEGRKALIQNRLNMLHHSLGIQFKPGVDARKPITEAYMSGTPLDIGQHYWDPTSGYQGLQKP